MQYREYRALTYLYGVDGNLIFFRNFLSVLLTSKLTVSCFWHMLIRHV